MHKYESWVFFFILYRVQVQVLSVAVSYWELYKHGYIQTWLKKEVKCQNFLQNKLKLTNVLTYSRFYIQYKRALLNNKLTKHKYVMGKSIWTNNLTYSSNHIVLRQSLQSRDSTLNCYKLQILHIWWVHLKIAWCFLLFHLLLNVFWVVILFQEPWL